MLFDFRCAGAAAFCALSLWAAAPAHAQQGAPAQADANGAQRPGAAAAPANADKRDGAARDAADRLQGAGGSEQSLLGAPAALTDPYRSAYDSTEQQQTDLMNAERVPRGALNQDTYVPQQRAGRGGKARPLGGIEAPDAKGANGNGTGQARTADDAAQSLYRGTAKTGGAQGQQVYRMPW